MRTNENRIDVVVIGELNVDIIMNDIESIPKIGKEIIANTMSVTLGSSSAIFASVLSTLGSDVAFIGKIGEDSFGQIVIDSLERKNVDIRHITKSKSLNTGATLVLNYDQDRANITYPGAMNDLCLKDIDFDFLGTAKHMHFSSCFIQPGIRNDLTALFKRAKKSGLTTSLDTQWDPEEKWDLPLEELLPFVDVFLPNAQEFKFLTKSLTIDEGINKISKLANCVIIKNGADGVVAWNGKEIIYQPAFRNNNVVDCIGAGDSFNAGFIREYISKKSITRCLETGALIGAVNTTRAGGTGAFENIDTVREIAEKYFNSHF